MIRLANPQFLWLLLLGGAALVLVIYAARKRRIERERFAGTVLLGKLAPDLSGSKILLKGLLLMSAVFLLVWTITNPQIGTRIEEVTREGVDIIVAVDVSNSMIAEDVAPNRLYKAKHELSSFIDRLKGDRIGIIAFAGAAFVQCPLTLDYSAAKMYTDILDTALIPVQGTALAEAISMAETGFVGQENSQKVLVIMTDGEDHEARIDKAVESAKEKGIVIYTVGMGSPGGAPIPGSGGYLQDKSGSVVLSKLNEGLLSDIALKTGGGYYRATTGEDELDKIYEKIFGMDKTELSARQFTDYEDRFQYFALLALLLLLAEMSISEKKGAWIKFFKID